MRSVLIVLCLVFLILGAPIGDRNRKWSHVVLQPTTPTSSQHSPIQNLSPISQHSPLQNPHPISQPLHPQHLALTPPLPSTPRLDRSLTPRPLTPRPSTPDRPLTPRPSTPDRPLTPGPSTTKLSHPAPHLASTSQQTLQLPSSTSPGPHGRGQVVLYRGHWTVAHPDRLHEGVIFEAHPLADGHYPVGDRHNSKQLLMDIHEDDFTIVPGVQDEDCARNCENRYKQSPSQPLKQIRVAAIGSKNHNKMKEPAASTSQQTTSTPLVQFRHSQVVGYRNKHEEISNHDGVVVGNRLEGGFYNLADKNHKGSRQLMRFHEDSLSVHPGPPQLDEARAGLFLDNDGKILPDVTIRNKWTVAIGSVRDKESAERAKKG